MGYYNDFIEKQEKKKAKDYYWNNREHVLQRQNIKKFQTKIIPKIIPRKISSFTLFG